MGGVRLRGKNLVLDTPVRCVVFPFLLCSLTPPSSFSIPTGIRFLRQFWRLLNRRIVRGDRKSTRLNSSHGYISYAVFCLKKKKKRIKTSARRLLRQRECRS